MADGTKMFSNGVHGPEDVVSEQGGDDLVTLGEAYVQQWTSCD